MYFKINNGAVAFGADIILHHINFEIRNREKIAVVGRNGCGKTTLLKLISGEVDLAKRSSDEDIYITQSGNPVIGYLKQMAFEDDEETLYNEVRKAYASILALKDRMDELTGLLNQTGNTPEDAERYAKEYTRTEELFSLKGGYDIERECDMMLSAFGFPRGDRERKLSEFSGGQRTKIAFVKLLLSKPDILLLDEPTNHLDIASVEWLEQYVKDYKMAVVIVSHDRMFLDNVVNVVYEIEYGTSTRYPGNYTDFVKQKREHFEKQMKDYSAQQKEIERLSAMVEKFKHHPTKVSMAWSKQKAIDHMERIEMPDRYDLKSFHANCMPETESGSTVLTVRDLGIGYDRLLSETSFELKKGRKLAVIGANGTGKSTLLKTLVGLIPPLSGSVTYGLRVEYGYFDQQVAQYSSDKTVLDDMWDAFPKMTETEVRTLLGSFLFSGDDVFKEVSVLSGGERSRLQLAKLFKRRPNFLILDEPTNHMDIVGKEKLEEMLKDYTGTVLFVSHDRYMVQHVADSLLIFGKDGVRYFDGTYQEYLEKKPDRYEAFVPENRKAKKVEEKPAQVNIGKEKSRLLRKMEKIEAEIEAVEQRISENEEMMNDPAIASDFEKLSAIQQAIEDGQKQVETLMEAWEALASEESSL